MNYVSALYFVRLARAEYDDDPAEKMAVLNPRTEGVESWRANETECSIVTLGDNVKILVPRGTEPGSLADWLTNGEFSRRGVAGAPGGVHEGFADEVDETELWAWLIDRLAGGDPVFVTGHSKGGADALYFAHRIAAQPFHGVNVVGGQTFGAPRIHDRKAARWFDFEYGESMIRWVHNCDPVPRVPMKAQGYDDDFGLLAYIDYRGDVSLDPGRWQLHRSRIMGAVAALRGGPVGVEMIPGISAEALSILRLAGTETSVQVSLYSTGDLRALGLDPEDIGKITIWAATITHDEFGQVVGGVKDMVDDHFISAYVDRLEALVRRQHGPLTDEERQSMLLPELD